jgi:hypothetical protein
LGHNGNTGHGAIRSVRRQKIPSVPTNVKLAIFIEVGVSNLSSIRCKVVLGIRRTRARPV